MLDSPLVIVLAGLDPTGGAGLAADIKAVSAASARIAPLLSANTIQGDAVSTVFETTPVEFLRRQLFQVVQPMKPSAMKTGMIGSEKILSLVKEFVSTFQKGLPLVVDPVKSASSGGDLVESGFRDSLLSLGSFVTLLTPNKMELEWLSGIKINSAQDIKRSVKLLGEHDFKAILVKGGHFAGNPVDLLFVENELIAEWSGKRYDHSIRGTGCMLASYTAAKLAAGEDLLASVKAGYDYVQSIILKENASEEV